MRGIRAGLCFRDDFGAGFGRRCVLVDHTVGVSEPGLGNAASGLRALRHSRENGNLGGAGFKPAPWMNSVAFGDDHD